MRSEIKYLVPSAMLPALREAIAPMVNIDKHGQDYINTGYIVRSLYLDTPRLRFYTEKLDGLKERKKLRIRAYNMQTSEAPVFLEIKRKTESRISKTRAAIRFENVSRLFAPLRSSRLSDLIDGGEKSLTSAYNFFYHLHKRNLQCVNLVVYEREAFEGKVDPSLRITFDKNLRSKLGADPSVLYQEDEMTSILPGHFILEIKYNYTFPYWLTPILAKFNLHKQALSKYCMSLEKCTGLKGKELLLSLSTKYRKNTPAVLKESHAQ